MSHTISHYFQGGFSPKTSVVRDDDSDDEGDEPCAEPLETSIQEKATPTKHVPIQRPSVYIGGSV